MKIEEIYRLLDNYHNQLNANKEKFEKIYNENTSSMTEIRNILLAIFTIFATILIAFKDLEFFKKIPDSEGYWICILIVLGISGFTIYFVFSRIKKKQEKKLLDILKEFHDGFTTISFMKSFLARTPSKVKNLETKQLEGLEEKEEKKPLQALENYYRMVLGGITFKIRSEIKKTIKEEDAYGENESDLYTMLIYNASQRYKKQKWKEEEENLITKLFNKNEKDDLDIDDLDKLKKKLDFYKERLHNKYLLMSIPVEKDGNDIGKIVAVNLDNCKSFIKVKGHLRRRKIQLEPEKIKDWKYDNKVKL